MALLGRLAGTRLVFAAKPSMVIQQRGGKYLAVVLLKDCENVGMAGEERMVKAGQMRNSLYPNGIATYATPENVAKFKTVFDVSVRCLSLA